MATLTLADGRVCGVRSRHLIGRSRAMHTQLNAPEVSAQHAVIAWVGGAWSVRDLGSRNGTWVNGTRLMPGEDAVLAQGDRVGCGEGDATLVLSSAAPPQPFAVCEDQAVLAEGDALGLPSLDDPAVLIRPSAQGGWVVETEASEERVHDGHTLALAGTTWTLVLPEMIDATVEGSLSATHVSDLALTFRVSQDEEFVEVDVAAPGFHHGLPARAHHYTTLILARARLKDADAGVPDGEQGWLYAADLAKMLRQSNARINLSLHRARRELEEIGVADPHELFERRSTTRQVRIGVAELAVHRL